MSTPSPLDRIGVGIDTARYGHRVSFVTPDHQPAAKPLTVMENRAGYQALEERLKQLRERHPQAHFHVRIDAAGQYAVNLEPQVEVERCGVVAVDDEPQRIGHQPAWLIEKATMKPTVVIRPVHIR